jgi:hypothetical protein
MQNIQILRKRTACKYKNVDIKFSGRHHHLIENKFVLAMIWQKNCSKTTLTH